MVEAGTHVLGAHGIGAAGTLAADPGAPTIPAGTGGIAVS